MIDKARSPSGKAEVCKTSIGGSIPPRASKTSCELSAVGLELVSPRGKAFVTSYVDAGRCHNADRARLTETALLPF